jgi:large subunit ribosomal protein L7/L12
MGTVSTEAVLAKVTSVHGDVNTEHIMNIPNEQIVEALGAMTVNQLCELTKAIEDRFEVKAADATQPAPAPTVDKVPVAEEQTEFKVILSSVGENKIKVLKVIRELTGATLLEASKLAAPGTVLKGAVEKSVAEKAKADLEAVGAQVELQ